MKTKFLILLTLITVSLATLAQSDFMENPEEEQSFDAPVTDEVQSSERGFEREPGGEYVQTLQEQEYDPNRDTSEGTGFMSAEEEEYAEEDSY